MHDDMTMLHPVPVADSVAGSHEITRERQIMAPAEGTKAGHLSSRPLGIRLEHSWIRPPCVVGDLRTAVSEGNQVERRDYTMHIT